MAVADAFFLISFIAVIGITAYKFYNIMSNNKLYDVKGSILLFCGFMAAWFISQTSLMANLEKILFIGLFEFESVLMILNILFFIIEIIWFVESTAKKEIEPYNSKEAAKSQSMA